ncbi:hypothetical protein OO184_19995 [Photorhabdus sp. APURE]|uniref:hypothetical protein n=1 Tax=Photorhabdus aballayi TaxID=2991723 RepID=UPI00223D5CC7|nr:hypothetical protein [Photorhabdus aballayi]MCW7550150.1 hypothetical protein [Photorhabdus aballayi]
MTEDVNLHVSYSAFYFEVREAIQRYQDEAHDVLTEESADIARNMAVAVYVFGRELV